jgi:hypothetical protein
MNTETHKADGRKAKEQPKRPNPMRPGKDELLDVRRVLGHIHERILIEPKAPISTVHKCGEDRLRDYIPVYKLSPEEVAVLTHSCYQVKAGSKVALTISFLKDGKAVKPKGTLLLTTERGKLSNSVIELDGTVSQVNSELATPDETIKITVKAILDSFRRGKVHLHLK